MFQQLSFKETQLKHARVKVAFQEKESIVKKYYADANLINQGVSLFLRAFKSEMKLEVWAKPKHADVFTLLHTYDFCASSGVLGPKRKEGDLQIPEGVYHINHFNPQSNFHLSLGINYPNASDKLLSDKHRPGSAIYIHGNCVTVGCIPITDDKIKELYVLCVEARNAGQDNIPVHIFPTRLHDTGMTKLASQHAGRDALLSFWKNLQLIYNDFERSKKLKKVSVDAYGKYVLGNVVM